MAIDAAALRSINALKKALRNAPITATARIAARAAPAMSALAQGAHASGKTVYDRPRARGVDGDELSLDRTGATKRALNFTATGRDIRTSVLPRYAKYLIGKYDLLPNGPLPQAWREGLREIAARVLYDEIHKGGAP
jgi:hypothetical protein